MAHVDVYTKTDPDGTVYHFRDDRLPGSGDCMFPIGYIYMSVDSTDPGTIFGGSWTPIGEGQVILSAGQNYAAGSTGGAASHTLTEDNIPAHSHGSKSLTGSFATRHATNGGSVAAGSGVFSTSSSSGASYTRFQGEGTQVAGDVVSIDATHTHSSFGKATPDAISNMQPYLAAYMWTRTA